MKQRYHVFRRENGIYYSLNTITRKRESLNTTRPEEAQRLLNALNEACNQPAINLQIARVYLQYSDPDLEYDPNDYSCMLNLILNNQADVVYGSRFSGEKNLSNPVWHMFGNHCLTWCSNLASGLKLTDEATCYKMFRREVFERLELEEDGFGFCPEVTAKISKLRVRVSEVPVSYHGRICAEGKKIRIRHGFNALHCII